jgi:hypothetical protein
MDIRDCRSDQNDPYSTKGSTHQIRLFRSITKWNAHMSHEIKDASSSVSSSSSPYVYKCAYTTIQTKTKGNVRQEIQMSSREEPMPTPSMKWPPIAAIVWRRAGARPSGAIYMMEHHTWRSMTIWWKEGAWRFDQLHHVSIFHRGFLMKLGNIPMYIHAHG